VSARGRRAQAPRAPPWGLAVGGPIGAVVGAAVGAVAGGLGGKAAAEAVNPTIEDVGATSAASDAPDRSATRSDEPK